MRYLQLCFAPCRWVLFELTWLRPSHPGMAGVKSNGIPRSFNVQVLSTVNIQQQQQQQQEQASQWFLMCLEVSCIVGSPVHLDLSDKVLATRNSQKRAALLAHLDFQLFIFLIFFQNLTSMQLHIILPLLGRVSMPTYSCQPPWFQMISTKPHFPAQMSQSRRCLSGHSHEILEMQFR